MDRRSLTKKGAYFMSFFMVTLRGSEGFLMDVAGLCHHIGKVRKVTLYHVVIPLMVIFKGSTRIRNHLHDAFNDTTLKLKVRCWM